MTSNLLSSQRLRSAWVKPGGFQKPTGPFTSRWHLNSLHVGWSAATLKPLAITLWTPTLSCTNIAPLDGWASRIVGPLSCFSSCSWGVFAALWWTPLLSGNTLAVVGTLDLRPYSEGFDMQINAHLRGTKQSKIRSTQPFPYFLNSAPEKWPFSRSSSKSQIKILKCSFSSLCAGRLFIWND